MSASIKQSWSKNTSDLLKYAGPYAPTRNKNVKQESYILITTKTNCKSGSAWPTCFRWQKEWRNVAFFKQRETYRADETLFSECFGLCPFIWFSQNTLSICACNEVLLYVCLFALSAVFELYLLFLKPFSTLNQVSSKFWFCNCMKHALNMFCHN